MLNMDFKKIAQEFPRKFWSVVGVSFIDRVGGTMLFPFFALYITQKFHVGMTQAGVVLGLFSVFGLVGQMIGGALTDKFGRRKLIIFGLVFSAISTLAFGFINTFSALIPLAIGVGLLSDIAGPAHAAMIADILPENQRQEGFGILRVVGNLAWIFGPTIGGFVAGKSFLALFIIDAVISSLVALLFYLLIPETKPQNQPGEKPESLLVTFKGYFQVLRHGAFIAFMAAGMLMGLFYQQMYHSLSVYLRDNHGIDPKGYGFLLTASAIVVILFQFSMTRWIKKKPAFKMMALGTLFYMLGFSMFGFVGQYWLFVLAIMIITTGEMIVVPTSQALAVNFATEDMRGRYMGVFGITWMLPATIGPGAAGLILDHFNPNLLWYIGGALCAISALAYYGLHLKIGAQERFQPAQDEPAAVEDPAV
ncbi:MAG TPA: MFS transporter [Anaerolineaceae bacterium]|nr:MFS transporter [Anaerolineaceae bacterium]HNS07742.1 MFS transporter [Anaerolineaceae bacterium]